MDAMLRSVCNYKYMSARSLAGFDKYQYKSVDTSPLSNYVMHPFWNQLVKIFPLWVPANLLTLTGWLLSLLVFVVLSYYDPHYQSSSHHIESIPSWVWLLGAFGTFWAHQLDGCDGKQARRTNSSSPLGELFDHGLDSSAVWLMAMAVLSIFGINSATVTKWEFVFMIYFTLFAFYIAHWEKYTTSVLFLPWAYDISQIWLTGSYLTTYMYGTGIWKVTFLNGTLNIPILFKVLLYVLVIFLCVPFSLLNQYKARRDYPSDCVSVKESLQPLLCLGSVTAVHLMFGYFSTENIVESQLKLFLICYGILYSNVTCRLIVAQMAGDVCDRFNVLAWPLLGMIVISRLRVVSDYSLLVCYFVFLMVAHLHYGFSVVRQLCDHLKVYCFQVGKPASRTSIVSNGSMSNGHTTKNPRE